MDHKRFEKGYLPLFLSYYKPHLNLFLLDMCCALGIALVDLAFPYASRMALNELLPQNLFGAFFAVMAVLLLAYGLRAGMNYVVTYWGHMMGVRIEADIRRDLFYHMQDLSFSFYDKNRTGQLMSRATNDLFEITELSHHGPEDLFISVVTLGGAFVLMCTIQWKLALIVFAVVPVFVLFTIFQRRKMVRASLQVKQNMAGINGQLESSISGMRTAKGDISIEDVSFAYNNGETVLDHISIHIPQGETVAVVGPSGGGKSTLCQLIPRFYDVTGGRILVDGVDVRSVTQHSLRQNIGIVQQDVFLFAGTILDNIRYGRPDATEDEIIEAAKRAEIYDDIMNMPDGFQTYVGERGVMLSGGQKQRVSIARIFLKNPPILILDEATSALDSVTEARIQGAFDELAKGRTTLIIAHRLSTIRNAHRIIVVDDNRIVEEGTHAQLLASGGEYAQLYNTQKSVSV